MKTYKVQHEMHLANEPETTYKSKQAEIESWKNKYLELLERYNQLLELTANWKKELQKLVLKALNEMVDTSQSK